jgi:hypothetical protein
VLPFANVVHLFADELARLRGRRLSFARILACSFQRLLIRHPNLLVMTVERRLSSARLAPAAHQRA